MSNVLSEIKKQQVLALGRLEWTLRRIEQSTGVRRETASAYLKEAGIAVRPPGGWGRRTPAKPANGVTTDSGNSKPANEVTADPGANLSEKLTIQAAGLSLCEPSARPSSWNKPRAQRHGHLAGPGKPAGICRWV
jgi:hypothetical protein